MRKGLLVLAVFAASSAGAAPALAAPLVPQDCHELSELLHIQNVRACGFG